MRLHRRAYRSEDELSDQELLARRDEARWWIDELSKKRQSFDCPKSVRELDDTGYFDEVDRVANHTYELRKLEAQSAGAELCRNALDQARRLIQQMSVDFINRLLTDVEIAEDDDLRPAATFLASPVVAIAPASPPTAKQKAKTEKERFYQLVGELWREIHPNRESGRNTTDEQLKYIFQKLHDAGFIPKRDILPDSLWIPIRNSNQAGRRFDTFLKLGDFFIKKLEIDPIEAHRTPNRRKFMQWLHSKGHPRKS